MRQSGSDTRHMCLSVCVCDFVCRQSCVCQSSTGCLIVEKTKGSIINNLSYVACLIMKSVKEWCREWMDHSNVSDYANDCGFNAFWMWKHLDTSDPSLHSLKSSTSWSHVMVKPCCWMFSNSAMNAMLICFFLCQNIKQNNDRRTVRIIGKFPSLPKKDFIQKSIYFRNKMGESREIMSSLFDEADEPTTGPDR